MNNENLLSIGELGSLCQVSHKTLRHYDKMGLLKPTFVNENNGYRYYSKWQISRICTIKQLQGIGVSLSNIKLCLENNGNSLKLQCIENILEKKEKQINEEIQILYKNIEKIQYFKHQHKSIEKILSLVENSTITIEKIKKRNMIFKEYKGKYDKEVFRLYFKDIIGSILEEGYIDSNVASFPMAIYKERFNFENTYIKIGYEIQDEFLLSNFQVVEILEGIYVSYIYKGDYSSLENNAYKPMYKFIEENDFEINGQCIEIYYLSENITDKQHYFVTEIQIPVKKL